jgi:hypothetical protein
MPSKVLIEAADEGHIAVLGAGLCTPAGEHMAHLLALAPGRGMTVRELLRLPCYHPLLEEGLRSRCSTGMPCWRRSTIPPQYSMPEKRPLSRRSSLCSTRTETACAPCRGFRRLTATC